MLTAIPYKLQQQLMQLKMTYSKKKETLINRLDEHQHGVEKIYKMFYDALDK